VFRICVYCGSKTGVQEAYRSAAIDLGHAMAARGWGLVYGGGNVGLMGLVADATLAAGGEVIGVIPQALATAEKELAHPNLTQLLVVADMHQRKAAMAQRADAFIALPGGYGTLEELFEMLAWAQLGFHKKPLALLNIAGYFDHLIRFLNHALDQGFLRERHLDLIHTATGIAPMLDYLHSQASTLS
jgi:hypothetical protein